MDSIQQSRKNCVLCEHSQRLAKSSSGKSTTLFTALALGWLFVGLPFSLNAQTDSEIQAGNLQPLATEAASEPSSDQPVQTAEESYALAAAFYSDQNWVEAIVEFRKVLASNPNSELAINSRFYLGESLIQKEENKEALQVFRAYLKTHPNSLFATRARFRIAECHYLLNDATTAKTQFIEFMSAHESDPLAEFALPYLGELHWRAGEPEKSRDCYQLALKQFPTSGLSNKCRMGLAESLAHLEQFNDAERFYRFVANQTSDELADLAQLKLAKMFNRRQHWKQASVEFDSLIRTFPESKYATEANYLIAKRLITNGDWQASWDAFQLVLDQPMDDALYIRVALDAAVVATRVNDNARAKQLLYSVRTRSPNKAALELLSVIEIDIANRDKDFEELKKLVATFEKEFLSSPYITRCIEPLARIHYDRGEFAQAALRYQQLIEIVSLNSKIEGNLPAWKYLLGLSRIGTGEFKIALGYLESIKEFSDSQSFEAATSFAIATALTGDKRWQDSIAHYQKYLDLLPNGDDATRCHADLAISFCNTGNLAQAIDALDPVVNAHSSNPSVLSACELIAELALESKELKIARRFYQIMAKSSDERFTTRGINGLVWSDDDSIFTSAGLNEVIANGIDKKLAIEAVMGKAQKLQSENMHQQTIDLLKGIIESHGNTDGPQSQLKATSLIDEARFRLAVSLQRTGGTENGHESRNLLETFLINQPEHKLTDLARYELAWVKHDLDDIEGARTDFETIVDKHVSSDYRTDACYRAAMLSKQLGDDGRAKHRLLQVIKLNQTHKLANYANYTLGEYECQAQNWSEAIPSFTAVINSDVAESLKNPAKYWLAESHYHLSNLKDAEDGFRSIQDEEFEKGDILAVIGLRLAQCAAKRKDWNAVDAAIASCRKQVKVDGHDYQLDYLQGRVYMSRAKFKEARQMFRNVLQSKQSAGIELAAMSQWMIGESYFHQQDYKHALRAYLLTESLYDFDQWRSLALLQAAKCHLHLGQPETARKTCNRMLATFPNSSHTSEAQQLIDDIGSANKTKPKTIPANFSKQK